MSRRTDKMWKTASRVTALPIAGTTKPKQLEAPSQKQVELATKAVRCGWTVGRFINNNTQQSERNIAKLQVWADAYSIATAILRKAKGKLA